MALDADHYPVRCADSVPRGDVEAWSMDSLEIASEGKTTWNYPSSSFTVTSFNSLIAVIAMA